MQARSNRQRGRVAGRAEGVDGLVATLTALFQQPIVTPWEARGRNAGLAASKIRISGLQPQNWPQHAQHLSWEATRLHSSGPARYCFFPSTVAQTRPLDLRSHTA